MNAFKNTRRRSRTKSEDRITAQHSRRASPSPASNQPSHKHSVREYKKIVQNTGDAPKVVVTSFEVDGIPLHTR